jgi:hypothetical protein
MPAQGQGFSCCRLGEWRDENTAGSDLPRLLSIRFSAPMNQGEVRGSRSRRALLL